MLPLKGELKNVALEYNLCSEMYKLRPTSKFTGLLTEPKVHHLANSQAKSLFRKSYWRLIWGHPVFHTVLLGDLMFILVTKDSVEVTQLLRGSVAGHTIP